MSVLTFRTVVTDGRVLSVPEDVILPEGVLEVTIRPVEADAKVDPVATRNWLLDLAERSRQLAPNLPSDLAQQHDHYAHGKPKS